MKLFFKKIGIVPAMLCGALFLCPSRTEMSVEPLKEYLAALKDFTQQQNVPQENLSILYTLLEQQELAAITPEIIDAAFAEAAACLEKKGTSESTARLVEELETHYNHALAITDTEGSQKRAIKAVKKYINLLVHHELSAGEVFVGGDTYINRNLTVNGNEIINGNLIVNGQPLSQVPMSPEI